MEAGKSEQAAQQSPSARRTRMETPGSGGLSFFLSHIHTIYHEEKRYRLGLMDNDAVHRPVSHGCHACIH